MKRVKNLLTVVFGAVIVFGALTLSSCSSNVQPVLAIGELHGGGIIADMWTQDGVQHGIILALTDQSVGRSWSNVAEKEVGADARNRADGLANSLAITAQPGHLNSAAKICLDYSVDGFSDWYLPAIEELERVYENREVINAALAVIPGATEVPKSAGYWSSTENGAILAWNYNFNFGIASNYSTKNLVNFRVRAIRTF
jgi:hypothetical protein